jgi:uncharacterized protein YndB with AHSA1/START domain
MTIAKTETADFTATKTFDQPPEVVCEALTTIDGIASWWGTTAGSAEQGGALHVGFGSDRQIDLVVVAARPDRVEWFVEAAPFTPEWDGTTIEFEVSAKGSGSELRFRHLGLTPKLECFDMCHEGWTHYLGSLVAHVDRGEGDPYRGE